jgi:hypothetical protein
MIRKNDIRFEKTQAAGPMNIRFRASILRQVDFEMDETVRHVHPGVERDLNEYLARQLMRDIYGQLQREVKDALEVLYGIGPCASNSEVDADKKILQARRLLEDVVKMCDLPYRVPYEDPSDIFR